MRAVSYTHLDVYKRQFREYRERIAAVIVEPVAGNMGVVPPDPGFLLDLRALTLEQGTVLIFDEVMTGFRVDYGLSLIHIWPWCRTARWKRRSGWPASTASAPAPSTRWTPAWSLSLIHI